MRRRTVFGPCRDGAENNRSGKRNFCLVQHFRISRPLSFATEPILSRKLAEARYEIPARDREQLSSGAPQPVNDDPLIVASG
jgi:hypothetical protein